MKYVLDTGFFLAGMDPSSLDGEAFISPEIRDEVMRGFPGRKMDYFLESGILHVSAPSEESMNRVVKIAERTGDISRLSKADLSIIALALDMHAVILTDDYSVQNTASMLGIEHRSLVEKGIKEIWKWEYRCTGCGRYFREKYEVCPVCGSPLKTVPKKGD